MLLEREELHDILEMKNIAPRKGVRIGDGNHTSNIRAEQLLISRLVKTSSLETGFGFNNPAT